MQKHRNIEVSGATLECTFYGSGTPVVLLANAGCSTGYFDDLARTLGARGLQTISINMRGVGESHGSLDGATLHDLANTTVEFVGQVACRCGVVSSERSWRRLDAVVATMTKPGRVRASGRRAVAGG